MRPSARRRRPAPPAATSDTGAGSRAGCPGRSGPRRVDHLARAAGPGVALASREIWRSPSAGGAHEQLAQPARAPDAGHPVPAVAGEEGHRVEHHQALDPLGHPPGRAPGRRAPQSWTTRRKRSTPRWSRKRVEERAVALDRIGRSRPRLAERPKPGRSGARPPVRARNGGHSSRTSGRRGRRAPGSAVAGARARRQNTGIGGLSLCSTIAPGSPTRARIPCAFEPSPTAGGYLAAVPTLCLGEAIVDLVCERPVDDLARGRRLSSPLRRRGGQRRGGRRRTRRAGRAGRRRRATTPGAAGCAPAWNERASGSDCFETVERLPHAGRVRHRRRRRRALVQHLRGRLSRHAGGRGRTPARRRSRRRRPVLLLQHAGRRRRARADHGAPASGRWSSGGPCCFDPNLRLHRWGSARRGGRAGQRVRARRAAGPGQPRGGRVDDRRVRTPTRPQPRWSAPAPAWRS